MSANNRQGRTSSYVRVASWSFFVDVPVVIVMPVLMVWCNDGKCWACRCWDGAHADGTEVVGGHGEMCAQCR